MRHSNRGNVQANQSALKLALEHGPRIIDLWRDMSARDRPTVPALPAGFPVMPAPKRKPRPGVPPEPKPEPRQPFVPPAHRYRETGHPIETPLPTPAPTRPGSPFAEVADEKYDASGLPQYYPEAMEMPDLEEEALIRNLMKLEGAAGSNYLTDQPHGLTVWHALTPQDCCGGAERPASAVV